MTDRQAGRHTDRQTQTHRQATVQYRYIHHKGRTCADRHTDGQTDKQTDDTNTHSKEK